MTRASQNERFNEQNNGYHVPFESWYISLPSSAKRQREMTKFYVFWKTRVAIVNFRIFFWNWSMSVHAFPEQVLRPIAALDRFTEFRSSEVKYKFTSYKGYSPPSPTSLLKPSTELITTESQRVTRRSDSRQEIYWKNVVALVVMSIRRYREEV